MAKAAWGRENFWVDGVVEPRSGWHFEQEYPNLDHEQCGQFLDALSSPLG